MDSQVKNKKSDKEFIEDLTTYKKEVKPSKTGQVIVEGALPQVNRKPKIDTTINGMRRVSY